jgi:hypothetical protein
MAKDRPTSGIHGHLEILARVVYLLFCHRGVDGVHLLELVVHLSEKLQLIIEFLHVHRADRELPASLHHRHDLGQPRRHCLVVDEPGQEVLPFLVSAPLDEPVVVRGIVDHQDAGGIVEALHQQADVVVGARGHGSDDADASPGLGPARRRVEEGPGGRGIVDAFEPSPVRRFLPVGLLPQPVVYGGDPAHGPAAVQGDEELGVRVLEEGVLFAVKPLFLVHPELGDPIRILRVQGVGEIDELLQPFFRRHRLHGDRHTGPPFQARSDFFSYRTGG